MIDEFDILSKKCSIKGYNSDFYNPFIEDGVDIIRSLGRKKPRFPPSVDEIVAELPDNFYDKESSGYAIHCLSIKTKILFICQQITDKQASQLITSKNYKKMNKFDRSFLAIENSLYPIWIFRFDKKLWKIQPQDYTPHIWIYLEKIVACFTERSVIL